mgnify:CR=1 FL=1
MKGLKQLRKEFRKRDQQLAFSANEFFKSMLERPFKERVKIAFVVLRGK